MQFAGMFFDLDDTLVDDDISTKAGVDQLNLHYKNELPEDRHNKWDEALQIYYPAFLRAEITVQALQISRIRHVLDQPELAEQEALAAFEYFMQHYVESTQLFPDALAVLKSLKAAGIRLGVISNGPDDMQQRKVKAIGLSDFFDVIVTAERAGVGKPNSGIFELALEELGLAASDCCCVGDNLENDAIGAQAAGLTGIFLDRTGRSTAKYDGPIIHSLDELLN
jgi:putative hydrolase of the HAD superfamily